MKFVIIIGAIALSQSALGQGGDSLRVASDKTAGGFAFPESCAYHAGTKALYVGNFGGAKLDAAAKDGQGYISKVGLDGKVLEQKFLPAAGGEALNKPKGIWIQGNRLWVTDIDAVWLFDLKTKKGLRLALPVGFANDPTSSSRSSPRTS